MKCSACNNVCFAVTGFDGKEKPYSNCCNAKILFEDTCMNKEFFKDFDDFSIEINEDGESECLNLFTEDRSKQLKITGIISAIYCEKFVGKGRYIINIFVEDSLIFNISLPDEQTFSLYESIGELI